MRAVTFWRYAVSESEITSTILRIAKSNERIGVLTEQGAVTNERLSMVETGIGSLAAQLTTLIRYIKTKHDPAITDLLRRVARLEKKVG
jgi:hypothetical protein